MYSCSVLAGMETFFHAVSFIIVPVSSYVVHVVEAVDRLVRVEDMLGSSSRGISLLSGEFSGERPSVEVGTGDGSGDGFGDADAVGSGDGDAVRELVAIGSFEADGVTVTSDSGAEVGAGRAIGISDGGAGGVSVR